MSGFIDRRRPARELHQWAKLAEKPGFDVAGHPKADFHKALFGLSRGYEHVLIDCRPE